MRYAPRHLIIPFVTALAIVVIYLTLLDKHFHANRGVYKPPHPSKRPPSQMPTVLDAHGDPKTQEELDIDSQDAKHGSSHIDPCTVVHPLNRAFIDLRELTPIGNDGKPMPWIAKGYESGHNYTVGICSSPLVKNRDKSYDTEDLVVRLKVGAFYLSEKGEYVSLGEFSSAPRFFGNKLSLLYENGAYCDKITDTATGEKARKSTLLTFTCSRSLTRKASVQYLGSFDDCKYVFEVKSIHACPTAPESNNMAATGIFALIVLTALGVYYSGELLYRRFKTKTSNTQHDDKEMLPK